MGDLSPDFPNTWTATQTFTVEAVFDGGIDLSTSGRIDSNVADAASASNFLLQPTTTLTSGYDRWIFRINNSSGNQVMAANSDGSFTFGDISDATSAMLMVKGNITQSSNADFRAAITSSGATFAGGAYANAVAGINTTIQDGTTGANISIFGHYISPAWGAKTHSGGSVFGTAIRIPNSTPTGSSVNPTYIGGWIVLTATGTGKNTGTITDWYGGRVNKAFSSIGTGSGITNVYGLYLEEQTQGATINNGIFLANATSGRKLIAMRDQNTWIGSNAAATLNLEATTAVQLGDATNQYIEVAPAQVKIGDIAGGDYVQIENTAGHLTLVGNATQWEDLRIEPTARNTGARAPAFEEWFNSTGLTHSDTTTIGVNLYSFDDAIAAAEKEVFFTMQMPHAWAGTAIQIHVHWVGDTADTNSAPLWGLEYNWKEIGATFAGTSTVYTDGVNYVAGGTDANITAGIHYISKFTGITPDSTQNGISSILIGRLFRNSSSGSDTYDVASNKCGLLYIDAHYEINSLGSNSEYTK